MDIEIIEFYLNLDKTKPHFGSLHIYIPSLDLDIRGCPVYKKGGKAKDFFIKFPHRKEYDKKLDKEVEFPIISFTDKKLYKGLLSKLIKKGNAFIKAILPKKGSNKD